MKIVLFCGGLGTRLREYSETIPKPMVSIGNRPILWHLMKYYAYHGHKDFILCLGYRADVIKQYFLNYHEWLSNDFHLSNGGKQLHLYGRDIEDWNITFVDTGLHANLGQRLKAVECFLDGEEVFMANYTDGLSDLSLPDYLDHFYKRNKIASIVCVRPTHSFDIVSMAEDGGVREIRPVGQSALWINGGFFVFKRDIFRYIEDGEELVREPFQRLIAHNQLVAYEYRGFWACMDTFKDKKRFDDMDASGNTPWEVWKRAPAKRPPYALGPVEWAQASLPGDNAYYPDDSPRRWTDSAVSRTTI
jgi:glucose-1-phosphate cytidylyltransferase